MGFQPSPNNQHSKFFNREWYEWQNPDWSNNHSDAFDHYLAIGREQLRDPSPVFDVTRYSQTIGQYMDHADYFSNVNSGLRGRAFGVYEDWNDLEISQEDFHSTISTVVHKLRDTPSRNKGLVFLQAGPGSLHREWYNKDAAEFDLLINYFNCEGLDPSVGDYVFSQVGTKFTAFARFCQNYCDLYRQYDHVFLLDDDIYIKTEDINRMFRICRTENLDAAQPSLSSSSNCVWPLFFNSGQGLRNVNGVEIMMPVLSRNAISNVGPYFYESVSGFGLDLLIGKVVTQEMHGRICVIDSIQARHEKPIDDVAGAYYENMRKNLINPKAELWRLITEYNLENTFHAL